MDASDRDYTRIRALNAHIPKTVRPSLPTLKKYRLHEEIEVNDPFRDTTIPAQSDLLQWTTDLNRASLDSSGKYFIEFGTGPQRFLFFNLSSSMTAS